MEGAGSSKDFLFCFYYLGPNDHNSSFLNVKIDHNSCISKVF